MINQLIIILTDKQQAELIKRAEKAGYDDDLEYLQIHLSDWLKDNSNIAEALAKRLAHTEK